jgi:hypothetical protein
MPGKSKPRTPKGRFRRVRPSHVVKGALHKQLGYSLKKNIPKGTLNRIAKAKVGNKVQIKGKSRVVTDLLKKRAVFAYDLERYPKVKS